MIQKSTLQFLSQLKKNNNREWFEKNRSKFEAARSDFESFTTKVIRELGKIDESIAHLEARASTFRQNRDVRFSKDKSPYKVNMGMYLSKGGRKGIQAGYYFHLEPGSSMVAGGLWMPMAPELKKVRQEIDYSWDDFRKIIHSKKFTGTFGDLESGSDSKLSRPPKGYEPGNPAIEYLKLKSVIATRKVKDEELASPQLVRKIVTDFAALKPLVDFLNRAVEE
jgi:uncharacterized protein (TIGR02453 family)